MTTVNPPTSNGGAFEPLTLIRAEEMNDELDAVTYDLNYITGVLQAIYDKLDTIEPGAGATLNSDQIISLINLGSSKININRLSEDVIVESDVTAAIAAHKLATTQGLMHPETSIKSTELSYSTTPTSYVTSPTNLLDEIKNLRYAIQKVTGKTTWVDTPTENLTQLTAALDVVQAKLAGIEDGATGDMGAADILTAIKTVDGPASGLNADLLDNQEGAYYAKASDLTSHIGNSNNPHGVNASDVGLGNVQNVRQWAHADVETTVTNTGLTTKVPSSFTMNNAINKAFGLSNGYTGAVLYKQDTTHYGGKLQFEGANGTFGNVVWFEREDDYLRMCAGRGSIAKVISYPQLKYTGTSATTYGMSVNFFNGNLSVTNNHWSATSAQSVQSQIAGPCMITGGIVSRSSSYGFVEWSLDGSNWYTFSVGEMAGAPSNGNNNVQMGSVPCSFIPSGTTLSVRAGSTFNGSYSNATYGGGYQIYYTRL